MAKLVTIDTFSNPHQADMAKLVLDTVGIPSVFDNRNTVEMDWLLSNAIGHIRLQVLEQDVERAQQALAEHRAAIPATAGEEDHCLSCGAAMTPEDETCRACGWSYAEGEGA